MIRWVEARRYAFDPFLGDQPYRATMGQRASELAVALYVHRALLPGQGARVEGLVEFLHDLRVRPEFAHRVLRNPAEFVLNADLYGLLRLLGRDDPHHRELIQRAVDAGFLDHVERHPHRELDVRLALEWAGVEHPWPSIQQIVAGSPLVRGQPSALFLDESALYALTHIVMFATDFGLAGERYCDRATLDPIAALIPTLTLVACVDRHWDLVGELLICHQALGLPRDEGWRQAWDAFLDQQLPNGAFPGPESALDPAEDAAALSDEELDRADIAHCYHTTLIGWIALAGRLADGDASGVSGRAPEGSADAKSASAAWRGADSGEGVSAPWETFRPRQPLRPASTLVDQTRATAAWLTRTLHALEGARPTAGEVCTVVVGAALCNQILEEDAVPDAEFARAAHLLDQSPQAPGKGVDAAPATRILAAAALLRRGVTLPPYLHLLPDLAHLFQARDAEGDPSPAGAQGASDPALQEARALVAALGLCAPLPPDPDFVRRSFAGSVVTRTRAEQLDLLSRIEGATAWGARTLPDAPTVRPWIPVLRALATAAFRQLDMELGCRTLRALRMLHPDEDTRPWQDYLLFHARPDGAFGFFGPEERSFRISPPPPMGGLRPLEIATTTTCLWTLAEMSRPGWAFPSCLRGG